MFFFSSKREYNYKVMLTSAPGALGALVKDIKKVTFALKITLSILFRD
jgi:hypothetical protein